MRQCQGVALQKRIKGRRAREVAGVGGVEFLPPVGRMNPDEIETATLEPGGLAEEFLRLAKIETVVNVARFE